MKTILVLLTALMCWTIPHSGAFAAEPCIHKPEAAPQDPDNWTLKRGINLNWWWWRERRHDLTAEDIQALRDMGFTFVRLPVSEEWIKPENVAEMRCDIVNILDSGMAVILDFHPSKGLEALTKPFSSDDIHSHLIKYWTALRPVVEGFPLDRFYLQLLNEPSKKIWNWWSTQEKVIKEMRGFYPDHTIIASGVQGSFWKFTRNSPYEDPNIIYDFHFYRPYFFAQHNAPWHNPPPDPREEGGNLRYPAALEDNDDPTYAKMQKYKKENWNKDKLAELLGKPIAWSRKHDARIICLEFGVWRYDVDQESRARWLGDVRKILEENDVPWAMWDYKSGFGLYDLEGNLDPRVNEALGLRI